MVADVFVGRMLELSGINVVLELGESELEYVTDGNDEDEDEDEGASGRGPDNKEANKEEGATIWELLCSIVQVGEVVVAFSAGKKEARVLRSKPKWMSRKQD